MFYIFRDAVFPTSNLHTNAVLHVYPHNLNLPFQLRGQKDQ